MRPMADLDWQGPAPRGGLERALRPLLAGKGTSRARVVSTADARAVPEPHPDGLPWLWLSGAAVPTTASTEAVLRGAYDVVWAGEPGAAERLAARVKELLADEIPIGPVPTLIGEGRASRAMLAQIAQAARTSMPVLLTGETGTGKEIAARLIHSWSARAKGAFVPVNCAAIPNELMEGELFGYTKGAFSGAVRDYDGLMMGASGGTVFLDEIDDTPHSLQVKLLRVLEDRVISRLGENAWRKADFRIIAATNRDLRKLIASGQFGSDFYERLAIVSIQLPTLRERAGEIPALAQHFIGRFYREEPTMLRRHQVKSLSRAALEALGAYPWPGNIRELRNVVFGALVYKRAGEEILLSDLPKRILRRAPEGDATALVDAARVERLIDSGAMNLKVELENLERAAVGAALRRAGGNATRAARLLGEVGRGASADPGGEARSGR
jgi:DNA-binding NtrC family response regulator